LPLGTRVLQARPWSTPSELAPLAGVVDGDAWTRTLVEAGDAVRVGNWLVTPDALISMREEIVAALQAPGRGLLGIDVASLATKLGVDSTKLRAALVDEPRVVVDREIVRNANEQPLTDDPVAQALLAALDGRPFDPPAPGDVGASPALVRALVRAGELVDLDGVILTRTAFDAARSRVAAAVLERGTLTVSDVRDLLGSTRKYVVPLLNRLDAEGVTRRRGDQRVPGPRVNERPSEPTSPR
jgi:Elongation factor SelB, winged helix